MRHVVIGELLLVGQRHGLVVDGGGAFGTPCIRSSRPRPERGDAGSSAAPKHLPDEGGPAATSATNVAAVPLASTEKICALDLEQETTAAFAPPPSASRNGPSDSLGHSISVAESRRAQQRC